MKSHGFKYMYSKKEPKKSKEQKCESYRAELFYIRYQAYSSFI